MQHTEEVTLHPRRTPEGNVAKWITLCLSPSPQIPPKPVVPALPRSEPKNEDIKIKKTLRVAWPQGR